MTNYEWLIHLAVSEYQCPRCGAPKGSRCTTASGRSASGTHTGRFRSLQRAFRQGFAVGVADERRRRGTQRGGAA